MAVSWAPDSASKWCMRCQSRFSFITRRHHCRACGNLFCGKCSAHKSPIPDLGIFKPVRVCDGCVERFTLSPSQRPAHSISNPDTLEPKTPMLNDPGYDPGAGTGAIAKHGAHSKRDRGSEQLSPPTSPTLPLSPRPSDPALSVYATPPPSNASLAIAHAASPSATTPAAVSHTGQHPHPRPPRTPLWMPDASSTSCGGCHRRFTVFRRRTHCRSCGHLFCHDCCAQRISDSSQLASMGYGDEVTRRVCGPCASMLVSSNSESVGGQQVAISCTGTGTSSSTGVSVPPSSPRHTGTGRERPARTATPVSPPTAAAVLPSHVSAMGAALPCAHLDATHSPGGTLCRGQDQRRAHIQSPNPGWPQQQDKERECGHWDGWDSGRVAIGSQASTAGLPTSNQALASMSVSSCDAVVGARLSPRCMRRHTALLLSDVRLTLAACIGPASLALLALNRSWTECLRSKQADKLLWRPLVLSPHVFSPRSRHALSACVPEAVQRQLLSSYAVALAEEQQRSQRRCRHHKQQQMIENRHEESEETSCAAVAADAAANVVAFTPSPLRGFTHDELPTAHFWLQAYLTHVTWRGVCDPHSFDSHLIDKNDERACGSGTNFLGGSGIGAGILRNRGINCAVALLRAATATATPRASGLSTPQPASQPQSCSYANVQPSHRTVSGMRSLASVSEVALAPRRSSLSDRSSEGDHHAMSLDLTSENNADDSRSGVGSYPAPTASASLGSTNRLLKAHPTPQCLCVLAAQHLMAVALGGATAVRDLCSSGALPILVQQLYPPTAEREALIEAAVGALMNAAQLDTDAQEQIAAAGAISALLGVSQAAFITKALLVHSAARRAHRRQQSSGDSASNSGDAHNGHGIQDSDASYLEARGGAPTLPIVVQYVAGALWNLSNLGGTCRDELGERGGMGLLVQLAATEDEMLQLYCAGTIANGCLRHAGNKQRLRNVGGVQLLRKLLDSSAPKVRRTAAVALRNATFSDKPNQAELRASGGVLRLLDLLADADLKAATAAVATLMNCTHEDLRSRQQLLSNRGLPIISVALRSASPKQVEHALGVVMNCSVGGVAFSRATGAAECMRCVVTVLCRLARECEALTAANDGHGYSPDKENAGRNDRQREGAINALAASKDSRASALARSASRSVEFAAGALWNCSMSRRNAIVLCDAGVDAATALRRVQPLYTVLAERHAREALRNLADFANSEHRGSKKGGGREDRQQGKENGKGYESMVSPRRSSAHQHRSFVDRPQRGVALREGQVSFG